MNKIQLPQSLRSASLVAVIVALSSLFASKTFADSTWVGDSSQDWNVAANWSSDPSDPTGNFFITTPGAGPFPILGANSAFTPVDVIIGSGPGFDGRFDHRAGAISLFDTGPPDGNWFMVARSGDNLFNGSGTYNLADTTTPGGGVSGFAQGAGSITVGKFFVGGAYFNDNGTGVANINTTGTITANSTASFTVDGAGGQNASIVVGRGPYGVGTMNLENGTINAVGSAWVGSLGTGTVNQTGGTVNIGGELLLARNNNNTQSGDGTWTVSSTGVINVQADLILAFAGNNTAQGTMNINAGGTVNVATTVKHWVIVNRWDTAQGALNVNGGTLNLNANTDLRFSTGNSSSVGTSSVTLSSGAITSYSGNGTGSNTTGVVDMNHAGGATANNTFNLDGGVLTISQVISNSNNGTATFNFNGGTLKASNNSGIFVDLGGASQTAVVKAGGAKIDSNGFDVTVPQALVDGGGGGLTKEGAGTLALTGSNTFTGATVVNGGTLYANAGNAPNNRALSHTSGITVNTGATLRSSANGLFGWDGSQDRPITVNTGGTLTANGGLLSDVGVGTVTLAGGTMTTLSGGATDWGSFRFDDATDQLIATDDSVVSAENVKFGNASASIDVAANKTLNFTGTITDATNGGISYLTKSGGSGTLILANTNTYTGATTLNAGTLLVNGSINNSSVTVNGGLLGGNGSTGAVIVGASGSIGAGNSPGSLDINGNYTQSGTMQVEIAGNGQGTTYDLIAATGNGTLNNGSTVNVTLLSYNPGLGSFFDVFTALDINGGGNSLAGITFDYTNAPLDPGLMWQQAIVSLGGSGEALRLSVTPVPEPATAVLMLAGMAGLWRLGKRRRNG